MGGFGAVSYAARRPGLFRAAASYSGPVHLLHPRMREMWPQMEEAYGGDLDALWGDRDAQRAIWQAHDPHHLAERLRHTHVYLSTGDGTPGPLDPPDSAYDPAEAVIHDLMEAHGEAVDAEQQRERHQRQSSLRRAVADCTAGSRRLVENLELLERPDPSLLHEIAARRAELRAQQQDLHPQLVAEFNNEAGEHERYREGAHVPLSQVPVTAAQLSCLPDELSRPLFDVLHLTVRYDGRTGDALCGIVLPFAVTNDAPHQIPKSAACAVRCEVAVADRSHAEAVQKQQLQAMARVLAWLADRRGGGA